MDNAWLGRYKSLTDVSIPSHYTDDRRWIITTCAETLVIPGALRAHRGNPSIAHLTRPNLTPPPSNGWIVRGRNVNGHTVQGTHCPRVRIIQDFSLRGRTSQGEINIALFIGRRWVIFFLS
jgi:hypothetical protein